MFALLRKTIEPIKAPIFGQEFACAIPGCFLRSPEPIDEMPLIKLRCHRLEYIDTWPFKGSYCNRTFIVQFINEPLAKIFHGQPAMASGWTSI